MCGHVNEAQNCQTIGAFDKLSLCVVCAKSTDKRVYVYSSIQSYVCTKAF